MLGRVFDRVGTKEGVLAEWSLPTSCPRALGRDSDMGILISDIHNHNLQLISAQGDLSSSSFGCMGRSPGEFLQPCQSALTADEKILAIADSGNNRIQLFDARSRCFLESFGEKGQITPGLLAAPEGIAFVEGRPEIIVADTGNNRLQVFHVEKLGPIPDSRPGLVSKRDTGLPNALDAEPSGSHEEVGSLDSWSKYHLEITADVGSVQHGQEAGECIETGRRRLRNGRGEEGAPCRAQDTERGDKPPHQENKTRCLLVVDGCEEHSSHAPRITQPCDVAFWRPKSHSCGFQPSSAGSSTSTAATPFNCTSHETWVPDIPPWYRYASSQDEEALREQLLSLASPQSGCPSIAISPDSTMSARTSEGTEDRGQVEDAGQCRTNDGHEPEFREPEAGAFLVCETDVRGTLRLLVLEKQEMSNDTTDDGIHEGDFTQVSLPALSEKSFGTSTDSDWMDRLLRLGEEVHTSDGNELGTTHGGDGLKTKSPTDLSPRMTFESLDQAEWQGGARFSCRGEGFKRLSRITDTRGPRGIVAVAESGGGRVRLWHYAPCLAPFYATELRHAHSIEDFRQPSSVSFSEDGDLIVVDQEVREVSLYSQLSGVWSPIHKFGPDFALHEAGVLTSTLQGWRQLPDDGRANRNDGRDSYGYMAMEEGMEWQDGLPISARFFSSKLKVAVGDEAGDESEARCQGGDNIILLTSDGKVRILAGARRRDCGMFAALHFDTALFIVEHLGYRSSKPWKSTLLHGKVLGCVNRTMAHVRARLRQDWRLHPLTPFGLARIKLKFLQWGRLASGRAIPGWGEAVDVTRRKLCDNFLKTLSCSRPACPHSHNQPWIDPVLAGNNEACILFRSGVINAVTDLYGQIFAWEWEGELFRLFRERSFRRTLVRRRDRMAPSTHCAEAITIRESVKENHQVLDYRGFMEFCTVVHEHVIGLRSWYSRRSSSSDIGNNLVAAAATAREPSPTASKRISGTTGTTDGDRKGQHGEDTSSLEPSTSLIASSHPCAPLEAVPWMSWDFLSQRSTVEHEESDFRGSRSSRRSTTRFEGEMSETLREDVGEEPASNRIYGKGTERELTSINQLFAFQTDRVIRVLDRMV